MLWLLLVASVASGLRAPVALRPRCRSLQNAKKDAIFGPVGPDIDAWPKAKDVARTSVELWPRREAEALFQCVVAASVVVFALICLSSAYVALPGVQAALGGDAALSRGRAVFEAAVGRSVLVRRRVWSLSALWDGAAAERLSRGVALSTQSPLLGDLALDVTRAPRLAAIRARQQWRLLSYWLAHGSVAQVVVDAVTLRSALALGDRDRGGLPREFRRVEDASDGRLGACGGGGVLALTALAGVFCGGLGHLHYSTGPGARRALGSSGLAGALAGARFVAQARLLKTRNPVRRALLNLAPRLLVLLVGGALVGAPPALALGGCAGGTAVGLLAAPRVVAVEKEFALMGDARDAARNKKARSLAVTLGEKVKREPPILPPKVLFALALLLLPQLRRGLAQLLPALVTAAARPGALSNRALLCPPRWQF